MFSFKKGLCCFCSISILRRLFKCNIFSMDIINCKKLTWFDVTSQLKAKILVKHKSYIFSTELRPPETLIALHIWNDITKQKQSFGWMERFLSPLILVFITDISGRAAAFQMQQLLHQEFMSSAVQLTTSREEDQVSGEQA